jgi:hypothetical protein
VDGNAQRSAKWQESLRRGPDRGQREPHDQNQAWRDVPSCCVSQGQEQGGRKDPAGSKTFPADCTATARTGQCRVHARKRDRIRLHSDASSVSGSSCRGSSLCTQHAAYSVVPLNHGCLRDDATGSKRREKHGPKRFLLLYHPLMLPVLWRSMRVKGFGHRIRRLDSIARLAGMAQRFSTDTSADMK